MYKSFCIISDSVSNFVSSPVYLFVVQHELQSHCVSRLFSHLLDLQNRSRGRAPTVPSLRGATQSPAAVARLSHHQLRWYLVSGSSHCPSRGPSGEFWFVVMESNFVSNQKLHLHLFLMQQYHTFAFINTYIVFLVDFTPVQSCITLPFCFVTDWLHVWQRCVLCRHGVQECKLLSHLPVRPCRPPSAGRGCPRQHVSV